MPEICEICGNPIRGYADSVEVDGAVFSVCTTCSKLGKSVSKPKEHQFQRPKIPITGSTYKTYEENEMELRRDFNKIIKTAREKKGLSQEELGQKISEKISVIKHLESGTLKPNDILSKKIERFLTIQLLIPEEVEE